MSGFVPYKLVRPFGPMDNFVSKTPTWVPIFLGCVAECKVLVVIVTTGTGYTPVLRMTGMARALAGYANPTDLTSIDGMECILTTTM